MDRTRTEQPTSDLAERLKKWVVKEESGRVRLDQEVFTNEELFDLEMKHIFEKNWVFLGHESQVPKCLYAPRCPTLSSKSR